MGGFASRFVRGASSDERSECTMMLLGCANAGKSTVFKQMMLLYGGGFSDAMRRVARDQIIENVLETLDVLDSTADEAISDENSDLMDEIRPVLYRFRGRDPAVPAPAVSAKIWDMVKRLLSDDAIQKAAREACGVPLQGHSYDQKAGIPPLEGQNGVLLDSIDRISSPDYIPTDQDVLLLRRSTTGLAEIAFTVPMGDNGGVARKLRCRCLDVGGQSHEQSGWKRYTKSHTLRAVVFVASLAEYNTTRNDGENDLERQLKLFDSVCRSECFKGLAITVMLNKFDLFRARFDRGSQNGGSFADLFPSYDDKIPPLYSPEDALPHFRRRFEEIGALHGHPHVKVLPTTATDSKLMSRIIEKISHTVIEFSVEASLGVSTKISDRGSISLA